MDIAFVHYWFGIVSSIGVGKEAFWENAFKESPESNPFKGLM